MPTSGRLSLARRPDTSGKARVWIVLPTYNERDNLEPMVSRLLEILPGANVLVIDDDSPDGTGDLADAIAARDLRVSVIHRAGKQGLGAAYRAAFEHLGARPDCDVIVQMDCDFSHDPADVPRLLSALASTAELVLGSRYVPGGATPGWAFGRRIVSRGGTAFARTVLGLPFRDLTGGFKAWRADLLRSIDLASVETQGYGFQVEMTWRAHRRGAQITEVPIVFSERRAGQSKMSRKIIAEALVMVLRLRLRSAVWPRATGSTGLRKGEPDGIGLVRGTGGVAVDDLAVAVVLNPDAPRGGRLATHRAREPEAGT
ncbi:MAG: polyprenol monophosphomannose synthase [Candidatus Limnocylindria bacterium]